MLFLVVVSFRITPIALPLFDYVTSSRKDLTPDKRGDSLKYYLKCEHPCVALWLVNKYCIEGNHERTHIVIIKILNGQLDLLFLLRKG